MQASKGSAFEREICKLLSRWWTDGKRDDIFWRSSQSGGRATQRAKSGLSTYGSYGDVAAVDPIGVPLLEMFTIELKRGNSHGCPFSLLESTSNGKMRPWEKALWQATKSADQANSRSWLLIHKKDHKEAMIYMDSLMAKELGLCAYPCCRLRLLVNWNSNQMLVFNKGKKAGTAKIETHHIPMDITGMRLTDFLQRLKPERIKEMMSP